MRGLLIGLVALGCGPRVAPPPVSLVATSHGGRATLAAVPGPGVRINAQVAPALELNGGTVLRLTQGRMTSDSAYFAEPPWALRRQSGPVRGILRISYCRTDEALCRAVALPVALR
ncbi:MAG: hypothetical protein H0T44_01290 [Gemmatimonadales bacterium]|nr:hypothetical protein [Gemmatimonadales bacterium]MDQ3427166.1 hypothetical protein [Gemmatimonadota bacterium]